MGRTDDLSESLKKEQEHEKLKKQAEDKHALLKRDYEVVFATDEGKNVLRDIMHMCGYQKSSVIGNAQIGLSVLEGTLHNEAQRSIYLKIRQRLPKRILIDVELDNVGI